MAVIGRVPKGTPSQMGEGHTATQGLLFGNSGNTAANAFDGNDNQRVAPFGAAAREKGELSLCLTVCFKASCIK